MPKTETLTNGIMIDGQFVGTQELLRLHDQAVKAQATTIVSHARTIADLRTEIEQLQEAVDSLQGGEERLTQAVANLINELMPASTSSQPQCRMRINITKNTKGYQYDTTVEVAGWGGSSIDLSNLVADLNRRADLAAREEIEQRIGWDQHPHESDDLNEVPF